MTVKIDFHVHTDRSSDCIIVLRELAAKSRKLRIVPAITDHDSISAHEAMRSLRVDFIPGNEISTKMGDIIGLYLTETVPPKLQLGEALDRVRAQGGLVCLPHMYDSRRNGLVPPTEYLAKIDLVEVFNARCLAPSLNGRAASFAEVNGKLGTVGTDSHFLFEFGSTYAELPDFDLQDPRALMKALPKAKLVTRRAPFFVRGMAKIARAGKKALGRLAGK